LLVTAVLGACGGGAVKDGAPGKPPPPATSRPTPGPEPLSRYGNGPVYEVLGKEYKVLASSSGYRERGVASWYGTKFHGRLTSNREVYDMYALTAAHTTLPLPTWVEVQNLRNNKTVVVRVNDRGPFAHNRIIDLSYAAALELDMVNDGTSLVEVRALDFEPEGDRPVRVVTPGAADPGTSATNDGNTIFVQVGAFGDPDNAQRRQAFLRQHDLGNVSIVPDTGQSPTLYRVQIGPVADVFEYDQLVDELAGLGIDDPWLVTR
jgi:rare lipoprotein A